MPVQQNFNEFIKDLRKQYSKIQTNENKVKEILTTCYNKFFTLQKQLLEASNNKKTLQSNIKQNTIKLEEILKKLAPLQRIINEINIIRNSKNSHKATVGNIDTSNMQTEQQSKVNELEKQQKLLNTEQMIFNSKLEACTKSINVYTNNISKLDSLVCFIFDDKNRNNTKLRISDEQKITKCYYIKQTTFQAAFKALEKYNLEDFNKIETLLPKLKFYQALERGDLDSLKSLYKKKPELLTAKFKNNYTILHLAIANMQKNIFIWAAKELKNKNSLLNFTMSPTKIKSKKSTGFIPLEFAIKKSRNVEIIKHCLIGLDGKHTSILRILKSIIKHSNFVAFNLLCQHIGSVEVLNWLKPNIEEHIQSIIKLKAFDILDEVAKFIIASKDYSLINTKTINSFAKVTDKENKYKNFARLKINASVFKTAESDKVYNNNINFDCLNITNKDSRTPLHIVCITGKNVSFFKETVNACTNKNVNSKVAYEFFNIKDNNGYTALDYAIIHGYKYFYLKLKNHITLSILENGMTPIMLAAESGNMYIFNDIYTNKNLKNEYRKLSQKLPNPTKRTHIKGKNGKKYCTFSNSLHIAIAQNNFDIVKKIIAINPELINSKTKNNETCYYLAAKNKNLKILNILITQNNNMDIRHKILEAILQQANQNTNKVISNFITTNSNTILADSSTSQHALHYAITHNNFKSVKEIISKKYELINSKTNNKNESTYYLAAKNLQSGFDVLHFLIHSSNTKTATIIEGILTQARKDKLNSVVKYIENNLQNLYSDSDPISPLNSKKTVTNINLNKYVPTITNYIPVQPNPVPNNTNQAQAELKPVPNKALKIIYLVNSKTTDNSHKTTHSSATILAEFNNFQINSKDNKYKLTQKRPSNDYQDFYTITFDDDKKINLINYIARDKKIHNVFTKGQDIYTIDKYWFQYNKNRSAIKNFLAITAAVLLSIFIIPAIIFTILAYQKNKLAKQQKSDIANKNTKALNKLNKFAKKCYTAAVTLPKSAFTFMNKNQFYKHGTQKPTKNNLQHIKSKPKSK